MSMLIPFRAQRGATLVVTLIMLTLITVLVTSAVTASSTNAKAVANMQFRDEAIAAANRAIEQILSSPFTNAPTAEALDVDIDNDGSTDYTVEMDAPTCVRDSEIVVAGSAPSSVTLGSTFSVPTNMYYETVWDLSATVNAGDNVGGASMHIRQGVRVLLTQAQYTAVCS